MALTGPVETPVTFNTIYEVDDLVKFLTKCQMDLDTRFDVISGMIKNIELNECGHIRFDNIRRMLENAVTLCEDIALSMGKFTKGLIEKKLIKRNTSLPQLNIKGNSMTKNPSSRWSLASDISFRQSANRLSVFDEELSEAKTQRQVSFGLMTPSSSTDVLEEHKCVDVESLPAETNEKSHPVDTNNKSLPADANGNSIQALKQNMSKVYVHLIPADPTMDLSAVLTELLNLSLSLAPENVKLEFVTSDAFTGLPSRNVSTSSDSQNSGRNRFKSSNESLSVLAFNNLSRFAVENSDISDEDNRSIRLISSSDSETSVKRYHLKPVIEKKSVETQTE
ncbi:uncharacterized protein LOC123542111 isoform X2 [Mercenaria mercenaria]|uniref:uncharacterized protein LOC123542111 isoform X2 n=1 Tax=Mercenaria mercenaria TaxID=6596 RepID=UPI00234EAC14|nr:uncharacterized protein LOC123542111 isoform X2 [Mercenaria mercenaria]